MTRIYDGLLFGTAVLLTFVGIVTLAGWAFDHIVRRDINDQSNPEDRT